MMKAMLLNSIYLILLWSNCLQPLYSQQNISLNQYNCPELFKLSKEYILSLNSFSNKGNLIELSDDSIISILKIRSIIGDKNSQDLLVRLRKDSCVNLLFQKKIFDIQSVISDTVCTLLLLNNFDLVKQFVQTELRNSFENDIKFKYLKKLYRKKNKILSHEIDFIIIDETQRNGLYAFSYFHYFEFKGEIIVLEVIFRDEKSVFFHELVIRKYKKYKKNWEIIDDPPPQFP